MNLVDSGMVDLLYLEVNADKTTFFSELNAEQTVCMFICGRQNHNINIASKYSENVSKFKRLKKH
jgi:hypothetical protein